MTETVPRWIIYWCVHIHSQGKLNKSKWRRMMSLYMVEVTICNVVFSLRQRNKNFTLFLRRFCMKMRPQASNKQPLLPWQRECCDLKNGIFVHPPECLTAFKNLKGVENFHFPFPIWFLQRLVLKCLHYPLCVSVNLAAEGDLCVSYCRLISTATPMNTKKKRVRLTISLR